MIRRCRNRSRFPARGVGLAAVLGFPDVVFAFVFRRDFELDLPAVNLVDEFAELILGKARCLPAPRVRLGDGDEMRLEIEDGIFFRDLLLDGFESRDRDGEPDSLERQIDQACFSPAPEISGCR